MARDDSFEQTFGTIEGDPSIVTLPSLAESLVECCYELPLLVEKDNPATQDPSKNDRTSYFEFYDNSIDSAEIKLYKCVAGTEVLQTTISDNTYGIYKAFGTEVKNNLKYISLKNIDWTAIFDDFGGAGEYQFRAEAISILPSTDPTIKEDFVYHLREFTVSEADVTVFMKIFMDGSVADLRNGNDGSTTFSYPDDWIDGKRLKSTFGNDESGVTNTYTIYNDGSDSQIESSIIPEYTLLADLMTQKIKRYFEFDVRWSPRIEMVNYISNSSNDHRGTPVQASGDFKPNYTKQYSKSSWELKFKHVYSNNFTKHFC